ncbi:glycosyltransferase family 2 protein [Patescibacteria group bacterium]|nr:glycosyltransferase family 2 protein [Patescibacteria group bacterium]
MTKHTMKLTAVVLTRNEQKNIEECLKTVRFCDEVIVVDDHSSDNTVKIARSLGARVYSRGLHGDFAMQRNFALEKANAEWVLFVDADERVSKKLQAEMIEVLRKSNDITGYRMKRQDIFLGKKLLFGETAHVELLRLGKKDAGAWKRPVHEVWEVEGKIGKLHGKLVHYPHPTIAGFLSEINDYTQIESIYRKAFGMKSNVLQLLLYPLAKFVKNFILLQGFLDGFPGLVMAFMMSVHSLCVRVKMMEG